MTEYRIEYTIQRNEGDQQADNWVEVGFGSSGTWDDIPAALYAVESDVQNRQWEREDGMPEQDEV